MGWAEEYLTAQSQIPEEGVPVRKPQPPRTLYEQVRSQWRREVKPTLETPIFGERGPLAYGYKGLVSSVLPFITPRVAEGVEPTQAEKIAEIGGSVAGWAPWFMASKGLKAASLVAKGAKAAKEITYLSEGLKLSQRIKQVAWGAREAAVVGAIHSMLEDTGLAVGTQEDTIARLKNAATGGLTLAAIHNAGILTSAGANNILKGIAPRMAETHPNTRKIMQDLISNAQLGLGMGAIEAPPGQRMEAGLAGAAGFMLGGMPFQVRGIRRGIEEINLPGYQARTPGYEEWLRQRASYAQPGAYVGKVSPVDNRPPIGTVARTHEEKAVNLMRELGKIKPKPTPPGQRTIATGKVDIKVETDTNDANKALGEARGKDDVRDKEFEKVLDVLKSRLSKKELDNLREIYNIIPVDQKEALVQQVLKQGPDVLMKNMSYIRAETAGSVEDIYSGGTVGLDLSKSPFSDNPLLGTSLASGSTVEAIKLIDEILKSNKIKGIKKDKAIEKLLGSDVKPGRAKKVAQALAEILKAEKTRVAPREVGITYYGEKKAVDVSKNIRMIEEALARVQKYATVTEKGETPFIKQTGPNAWSVVDEKGETKFTATTKKGVLENLTIAMQRVKEDIRKGKAFETRQKNQLLVDEDAAIHPTKIVKMDENIARKNVLDDIQILKDSNLGLVEEGSIAPAIGIFGVPTVSADGYRFNLGGHLDNIKAINAANTDGVGIVYIYNPATFAEAVRSGAAVWNPETYRYDVGTSPKDFAGHQYQPDAKILGATRASYLTSHITGVVITPDANPTALAKAIRVVTRRMGEVLKGVDLPLIKLHIVKPVDIDRVNADIDNLDTQSFIDLKKTMVWAMQPPAFKESQKPLAIESRKWAQYITFYQKAMQVMLSGKTATVGDLIREIAFAGRVELGVKLDKPITKEMMKEMGLSQKQVRYILNQRDVNTVLNYWKAGLPLGKSDKVNVIRVSVKADTPVTPAIFYRGPTLTDMNIKFKQAVSGAARWNRDRGVPQAKFAGTTISMDGKPANVDKLGFYNLTDAILKLTRIKGEIIMDYSVPVGTEPGAEIIIKKLAGLKGNPEADTLRKTIENIIKNKKNFDDISMIVKGKEEEAGAGVVTDNFNDFVRMFEDYYRAVSDVGKDMSVNVFNDLNAPLLDRCNDLRIKIEGVRAKPMRQFEEAELWLRDVIARYEFKVKNVEFNKALFSNFEKIYKVKDLNTGEMVDAYKGRNKKDGRIIFIPVARIERSIRKQEAIRDRYQGDIELIHRVLDQLGDIKEATKSNESFELYKQHMFKRLGNEHRTGQYQDTKNIAELLSEKTEQPVERIEETLTAEDKLLKKIITPPDDMINLSSEGPGGAIRGYEYSDRAYILTKEWAAPDGTKFAKDDLIVIDGVTATGDLHIKNDGVIEKAIFDNMAQLMDSIPKDSLDMERFFETVSLPAEVKDIFTIKEDPVPSIERASTDSAIWDSVDTIYRSMTIGITNRNAVMVEVPHIAKGWGERQKAECRPEVIDNIHMIFSEFSLDFNSRVMKPTERYYEHQKTLPEGPWLDRLLPQEKEFFIDLATLLKNVGLKRIQMGELSTNLFNDEPQKGSYLHRIVRDPKTGVSLSFASREAMITTPLRGRTIDYPEDFGDLKVETDAEKIIQSYLLTYANTLKMKGISDGLTSYKNPKTLTPAMIYMNSKTQGRVLSANGFKGEGALKMFNEIYTQAPSEFSRQTKYGREQAYVVKESEQWLKDILGMGDEFADPIKMYKRVKSLVKASTFSLGLYPMLGAYTAIFPTMGPTSGLMALFTNRVRGRFKDWASMEKAATVADVVAANLKTMLHAIYDGLIGARKDKGLLAVLEKWMYDKNGWTNIMFGRVKASIIQAWALESQRIQQKHPEMSEAECDRLAANMLNTRSHMLPEGVFSKFWGEVMNGILAARNDQVGVLRQVTGIFAPLARKYLPGTAHYPGAQVAAHRGMTDTELKLFSENMIWHHAAQLAGFLTTATAFSILMGGTLPFGPERRKDPNKWLMIGTGIKDPATGAEILIIPPVFKDIRDIAEMIPPIGNPPSYLRNKMDMTLRMLAEGALGEEIMGSYTQKITNIPQYAARKVIGSAPFLRLPMSILTPDLMQNIVDLYPRSTAEHLLDFLGARSQRGWGGLTAKEQNIYYEAKQFQKERLEEMQELEKKMDIAWAKRDMNTLSKLARERYVNPSQGLKSYIQRKMSPAYARMKTVPKKYRAQVYAKALGNEYGY